MHLRRLAIPFVSILILSCCTLGLAQTATPDRLVSPVVAAQRTVTNAVNPLATRQNDLGRVSGNQVFHRMILLLQRSPAQEADLKQLLKDQQDAKSPQFHKWLTPTEFGERFGPSQNDLTKIAAWLQGQGFTVEKPSNGRQFLFFTGTSSQVETAFQTEMHHFGVGGKTYIANAKPASIPSALAPDVRGVASLNSFGITHFKPQSYPAAQPKLVLGQSIFTGPGDLSTIYNATPLQKAGVNGQGQSIALIEESNIDLQDLTDFRTVTGLPAASVNVIVNGPDPGKLVNDGEEFEAISDVEYAGAFAPDATLNVIVTASTDFNQGIDLSTVYAVDYLVSPITSMSYGGCETLNLTLSPSSVTLYQFAYEQGAAEGISHFVSSGDNGGDACSFTGLSEGYGVNGIGDSPWNVSVGGTEFIMPDPYTYFPPPNYNATGYVPESTWNDYQNPYDGRPIAGAGGVSILFSKPDWQAGPGVPADGQRDVPDVSLLAGDNLAYLTCERDIGANCAQGYGAGVIGTSLASPSWASIQALVNQKNNLIDGAGNPDPVYYALAAGANSPFHDITVGDTKVPDSNGELVGYTATAGYDLATGLGSVDVNKLASNWMPATGSGTATVNLTTTATAITHGDPLTASVAVTASGSTVPSGDAVLLAGTEGVYQVTLDNTGAGSVAFGTPSVGVELPGGSYSLKAHYAGDTNFAPADSNAIALTVNPEPTVTFAQSNAPTAVHYGTPVTISAASYGSNSGTGYPVAGSYTFSENGVAIGTARLAQAGESFAYTTYNNSANLTLSGAQTLGAGTHVISVASPPASASFLASAAATPVSVTVVKSSPLVALTPDHTTPAVNTNVNVLVSVNNVTGQLYNSYAPVPVSGTATIWDYSTSPATNLGMVTLASAPDAEGAYDGTLKVSFATAGVHLLIATYSGDANDTGNVSGAVNITVGGKASTVTSLNSPFFAFAGNAATFTANVAGDSAGAAPTGAVTFTDSGANNGAGAAIGTAPIASNGTATLSVKTLAAGTHFIVASYTGDANYGGSVSMATPTLIGDFTLTSSVSTATVAAGQTSSSITLTYKGSADFMNALANSPTGPGVLLSCAGLPAGAACNFSQSAILPTDNSNGTTSGSATVTITTTGPTLQKAANGVPRKPWGGAAPLTLAGLLALGLPLTFRRRRYFSALLGLVLLAVVSTLGGCTKNTGQYNLTSPGTPAGTSNVIITGTINGGAALGTLAHTVTVAVTVNSQGS